MPVAWSSGWLLRQMIALDTDPEKWRGDGVGLGFGEDDPGWDPFAEAGVAPPPGWGTLPMHEEG